MYNVTEVYEHLPDLTGLPLVRHGLQWWGACRIDGSAHSRKDKLKCYKWRGNIFLREEGGAAMGLVRWMLTYTDAPDVSAVMNTLRRITCDFRVMRFDLAMTRGVSEVRYVDEGAYSAMSEFGNSRNPLWRSIGWWAGESWKRYGVMTDGECNTVYWYRDMDGRIVRDKRIMYNEDGHRDKSRGAWSRYRISDGYNGRCLFGEHLLAGTAPEKIAVVESEKTCVMLSAHFGRLCVAVGGKNNLGLLRRLEGVSKPVLVPDLDAVDEWSASGYEVWRWWESLDGASALVGNADIGDWIALRHKKIG